MDERAGLLIQRFRVRVPAEMVSSSASFVLGTAMLGSRSHLSLPGGSGEEREPLAFLETGPHLFSPDLPPAMDSPSNPLLRSSPPVTRILLQPHSKRELFVINHLWTPSHIHTDQARGGSWDPSCPVQLLWEVAPELTHSELKN